MNIKIRKQGAQKIKSGYPLIELLDLSNKKDEGQTREWHQFITESGEYIGTGYIGKQNKGIGWIVSRDKKIVIDKKFFSIVFSKAINKRQEFKNNDATTAFRLFNGEGDGVGGVTVDIYGNLSVFSWYNESIYSFKEEIIEGFKEAYPNCVGIYEKNRFESKDLPETRHIWGEEAPEPLIVKENGVKVATYLNEGLMTGIFLDQKEVRGMLVDGFASGLDVLNTFSYTGAFSVAAAMGGAKSTVSVDLAKRSLPKTKEMFEVNELSLDSNRIVVMDIFDYIRYANRKELDFDLVILDPPGFARNKKKTFSVAKNYGELVSDVMPLIRKDGYLIASTNVANLSFDKFKEMVEEGMIEKNRRFKLEEIYRLPRDFATDDNFEEGNYLKVLRYKLIN